ncbi:MULTISPECIES: hypothetical protein [unclassified Chamaesiphon]|nr:MULTISPECIES: hypothetical protein [unclassified Chamaesiphon]
MVGNYGSIAAEIITALTVNLSNGDRLEDYFPSKSTRQLCTDRTV